MAIPTERRDGGRVVQRDGAAFIFSQCLGRDFSSSSRYSPSILPESDRCLKKNAIAASSKRVDIPSDTLIVYKLVFHRAFGLPDGAGIGDNNKIMTEQLLLKHC